MIASMMLVKCSKLWHGDINKSYFLPLLVIRIDEEISLINFLFNIIIKNVSYLRLISYN